MVAPRPVKKVRRLRGAWFVFRVGAVFLCCVLGFVGAGSAAAVTRRNCGSYVARGETYTRLSTVAVSCRTARAVVRGWAGSDPSDEGWRYLSSPSGWRCRYLTDPVRFS